jgi:predicted secreted protein
MRRYIILILVSIYLLFITAGPVLAQMGGSGMMDGRGKASDMMGQGKSLREGQGMHGMGFMSSSGNTYGQYVTFTIDNRTGNVLNYGIAGTALFNISIANFNYGSTSTQGSLTLVTSTDNSTLIRLHDNPAAMINILSTKRMSVTFTLAEGVTATREDNLIRIDSGNITGYIVGTNGTTSSISGTQVRVEAPPNSAVIFQAAPVNIPMFDHMYSSFSEGIARNRMGMEIALGSNGTYDFENYSSGMQMQVQVMERDRIRLLVNATEPTGRIIAINLDNTSLVIGANERLRINYDGKQMQCVNDLNVVLNGTDTPLCWISPVQDRVTTQLIMYIPHFSEHTIDIVVESEAMPTRAAPSGRIITLDDNGKNITLQVNETFLLKLGEEYDWNITIDDQAVLSRKVNVLVVRGAQGVYEAHKPGHATLTAVGDPPCRRATPPCAAPSRLFSLNVVVGGGTATPGAPAFEAILAVSALLVALWIRRR